MVYRAEDESAQNCLNRMDRSIACPGGRPQESGNVPTRCEAVNRHISELSSQSHPMPLMGDLPTNPLHRSDAHAYGSRDLAQARPVFLPQGGPNCACGFLRNGRAP
jgi:hypothetical protein